jgi:hypothetical protein
MAHSLEELGSLFRKIMYDTLCGGDGSLPPGEDSFITWCMPGLPYREDDFDFAASGLGTAADAEGEKALLQHAFNFAMQADFIPDPKAAYTDEHREGVYRNEAGMRLSEIYGQILRFSKVVNYELTEEQRAKLESLRGKLRVTKTVKDLVTDEEQEVTEDSPLMKVYREKMQAYIQAAMAYNLKRTAAQAATGPEGKMAVMDWSNNAQLYLMQARAAMDDWTSNGYKNDVEDIQAYIDQTTQRSMKLWKAQLETFFEDALVSATAAGERFYWTTLAPGGFATAAGWQRFEMYDSMVDSSYHQESTSWSAGGGVGFGLFSVSGGVSSSSSEYSSDYQVDEFKLGFDMTQAQIIRPWFYPEFLYNHGWTLRKGEGWTFAEMPSDGGAPPDGVFVGYPLQAVFVRNVEITSASLAQAYDAYSSSVSASASVGWGPFSVNGSYSHAESGDHFHAEREGNTIRIPGLQIIGFVNHLLPKTPDPLPDIPEEQFE